MKNLLLLLALLVLPGLAFADVTDVVGVDAWLLSLLQYVTTLKGASVLVIAAGASQLLMLLFETPLANFTGKYRLVAVALFSFVSVVLGGMVTGMSFLGAALSSLGLTALQVLANQVYKQFFVKTA